MVKNTILKPNLYEIAMSGDSINRTDHEGLRQGIWNVYHESRYGDDAYFEIGKYTDNKKNGEWKTYSKSGTILKEENYYNNYLNGEVRFYDNGMLTCVAQYLALRTDVPYDTIAVEDPITGEFVDKVIPTNLGSVRNGFWKYYKPPYNEIRKIEEYQLDELIYEQEYGTASDSILFQQRIDKYPHRSHRPPVGFWTIDRGRKPPRYTDFPENMKTIIPNKSTKTKN